MAEWITITVKDIVQDIDDSVYVLPVIQRWLVWDDDKMSLLFDSLLKGNSFGGIMVLEEEKGNPPLFASRRFSRYGEEHDSVPIDLVERKTYLVIDGQQRLQSFYMGLKGNFHGRALYFNLFGSSEEYEFEFVRDQADAVTIQKNQDNGEGRPKLWYAANTLFEKLRQNTNALQIANEIIRSRTIEDPQLIERVQDNVYQFQMWIFTYKTVGLSTVRVNRDPAVFEDEKQRFVELFRRLNDGGTRLSALDLMASVFKGFDYRMEQFFKDTQEFRDMRLYQDEIIKFIFILQNEPTKEVIQVTPADAEFVLDSQDRIVATLKGLRNFLKYAGMFDYYRDGSHSSIPLYFIAYHIYYSPAPTEKLPTLFNDYDTNNPEFLRIKRWLYLSVLNSVFSRGCGWIPYITGIRKILRVLSAYQGDPFPVEVLFDVYKGHPLRFSRSLTVEYLADWDRDFVFYLMYDRHPEVGRDVDHVHPKSRLGSFRSEQVHSIANYQLLDIGTNRNKKRAQSLTDWINGDVSEEARLGYLNRHLIPSEELLWFEKNFEQFVTKRAQMIVEKVQEFVPEAPLDAILPDPKPDPVSKSVSVNLLALAQLSAEQETHPILQDKTPLYDIFHAHLKGPWAGRYRNELRRFNIRTIADFAHVIMALKLKLWYDAGYANVYRFYNTLDDGQKIHFNQKNFGGWAWGVTLQQLKNRDFNWELFLVS